MESYLRFARPACRAIQSQGVKRVVAVSVPGRETYLAKNAGPITACLAKDEEIEQTGVAYRALWRPGFMENMLMQLPALKHQGAFFLPASPDKKAEASARLRRERQLAPSYVRVPGTPGQRPRA